MQDSAGHNRKIIEQFTLQAEPFSRLPGHSGSMQLLIEMAGVRGTDRVLDVACGPGLVACDIAAIAEHVTGIDLTPGMIQKARSLQSEKKLQNVDWRVGDVLPLPFDEASFSIVLTRYGFHHFLDPAAVLADMIRVCVPGGRVMVVDVVLPDDKVDAYNRMERLRDPSHVKALSSREMARLLDNSGLTYIRTALQKFESELEALLRGSFPAPGDAEVIRDLFRVDLTENRMGIDVHLDEGAIHYSVPILVVVGTKPDLPRG